jgi:DNA-binding NarL/FixJ family response regulator
MVRIIKDILTKSLGSSVTANVCDTEDDAFRLYSSSLPDWVIMDIKLAIGSGLNACARILREFPNAKIIVLTNYDDPEYREAAEAFGVHDFLLKENLSQLPEIIKNYNSLALKKNTSFR